MKRLYTFLLSIAVVSALPLGAQVTFNIDAGRAGSAIGPLHYGLFFEEINHAGDGGLYAELVRNRSFEDNTSAPDYWNSISGATLSLVSEGLLNEAQSCCLRTSITQSNGGFKNSGYWGISIVRGETYTFSAWVRAESTYNGRITVQLLNSGNSAVGSASINVQLTEEWQKIEAAITATATVTSGSLGLRCSKTGVVLWDVVSLMPPTYKNRPNGCRRDLAEMLASMHPRFMRFPGGCFVEGQARDGLTNRFEWKKTIGPIEERPGHWNVNWNYRVSDGLGFHEMLQLAEDLGAAPLFVVNIGLGHGWYQAYDELDEYIQEALDALEYANGDGSTEWGARRIAAGHPEPFNLKLIEIGNENYNFTSTNNIDQSDHYAERYRQFYDAIKARYPDVVCIGNVESWGTDSPSWRNDNPVEVVDEHYYRSPSWFAGQYNKYDAYDRAKYKVYAGEYAVTQDFGTNGHLTAALGEAIYMLGMERNSDVCIMASYAPIFVNENDQLWRPDMIRFNSSASYGTPSYWVQHMMSNNVGAQNVQFTESGNSDNMEHQTMGLSTWSTAARFDNLVVTDASGNVLLSDDFEAPSELWTDNGGTWRTSDGVLTQGSTSMQGSIYANSTDLGENYTISLQATKTAGDEGFLIAFRMSDTSNYCWWNLGGWGNTQHAVEWCRQGAKQTVAATSGSLVTGQTYNIRIEVRGDAVKCYLNGSLLHSFSLPVERQLYAATSLNAAQDTLIVKIVNPSATDLSTSLRISNATVTGGSQIVLTASSGTAENTMSTRKNVTPKSALMDNGPWTMENGQWVIPCSAPAYSLSILKLGVTDVTTATDITAPDASTVLAVSSQLDHLGKRFCYIHADTQLPTFVSGAKVEWSMQDETQYAQLVTTAASQLLHVEAPVVTGRDASGATEELASDAVAAGTLIATVTYEGGSKQVLCYPVHVAPADDAVGYLYAFMNSTQEITNFALGTKAGQAHEFNVLLNGAEVFPTAELARIEGGTRDAYLGRGTDRWPYVILATDMCVARSGVWNNYGFDIIRSRNLMQWESTTLDFRQGKQIFSDPDAVTDAYTTDAAYSLINRVWAPQFVWDREAGRWLVYYSLLSSNSGDSYDKIYYSYTDDFESVSQPRLFFDPGTAVIDADIFWNPYDSLYHMLFKREAASGSARGIYEATSPTLVGGTWTEVLHITFEGTNQVEAPTSIRRINEDDYTFTYMRYSGGSAYKYCDTDHLGLNPTASHTLKGTGNFQHGSILAITQDEWATLSAWGQIRDLLNEVRALRAATGSTVYDAAIAQAENALASDDIHAAATALPAAIQTLEDAKQNNLDQFVHPGETTDFTSLLANPRFDSTDGWQGTAWTAIGSSGVAEQFNKSDFDDYQVLLNMPAGIYTFQSQGFYRNGSKSTAWNARAAGTEQLIPVIYIAEVDDDGRVLQESSTHYMSIYDESVTGYTFSPFTYPNDVSSASAAFNTAGHYKGNAAQLTLHDVGHLRVGIRKTGPAVANDWLCVDNFQLSVEGIATGVAPAAIANGDCGRVNYIYDISGRQIPAQGAKARGIYIVRPAQGGTSYRQNATKIIR